MLPNNTVYFSVFTVTQIQKYIINTIKFDNYLYINYSPVLCFNIMNNVILKELISF